MNATLWRRLARFVAIAIAVAAAIDPGIATDRRTRPTVSIVAENPDDSALADRVAAAMRGSFTTIRAALPGADASVIVGERLPATTADVARPVFAVMRDRSAPRVTIERVDAPRSVPLAGRVPVSVIAHVTGARGKTVSVRLASEGLSVDQQTRSLSSDDARVSVPLSFVPTHSGTLALRTIASVGVDSAAADVVVDARDTRWAVLVFDSRPSWMSRFVRRALEDDPRFVVTSRVVTSREVSTDAGQPPAHLDDLAALGLFDAVVVGAPEALSDRDVQGLDAFMRRRGGSVLLLLDHRASGPYERLVGVAAWANDSSGKTETVLASDHSADSLRSADLTWPSSLPPTGAVIAAAGGAAGRGVVWQASVGAGRVIVSGALDAWRFRDASISSFDRFWRDVAADAAAAAPPPVAIEAPASALAPGAHATVRATFRDAALSSARPLRVSSSAALTDDKTSAPVRVWPTSDAGVVQAALVAPVLPGLYRLALTVNGARADAPIVVARDAHAARPDDAGLLRAWVASRGGETVGADQIAALSSRVVSAIRPAARRVRWHPMRSPWWILPFALCLAAEWWSRRARGLR